LIINIKSPLAMRQRAFYVDMDVKRKVPYRELLYYFLVNSKNPDVPADASALVSLRIPHCLCPSNIALASANDFAGFDEVAFWQGIATWDACFPRLEIGNLRSLFESDLIEA
jgi:hypothetical protein